MFTNASTPHAAAASSTVYVPRGPQQSRPSRQKQRRKRALRIAIAAAGSLLVLAGAFLGGSYAYVQHEVGSIARIHAAALGAKTQGPFSAGAPGSMNVLLTASGWFPGQGLPTGLIEVLHLNADHQGGGRIVPGEPARRRAGPRGRQARRNAHGRRPVADDSDPGESHRCPHRALLENRLPSLPEVVGAIGGVYADVPYPTTSFGFYFHAGRNHITQADALAYVRQISVRQLTRTELQENLFRAILHKIANQRYFVATDWHVLEAVARAVSVDSDLGNSQLEHLALSLGHLTGPSGVSIDSVAQLAQRYPSLVTPIAPG